VEEHEVELAIGDTLHLGDQIFTVLDIEGDAIRFRVETVDMLAHGESAQFSADDSPWAHRQSTHPQPRPR
jgi:hypothetical protein